VVAGREHCDDGNLVNGDGCSATCEREFLNPIPASGDHFGWAVAAAGPNVVVGAPLHDLPDALNTGVAYLLSGDSGALLRTFENPTPAPGDEFGWAVVAVGQYIVVGAPFDSTQGLESGAVYVFDGTTGALTRTLLNPAPTQTKRFGWVLAAAGTNLIVGAPLDPTGAGGGGAAYVFDAATGALRSVLLNPTPAAGDEFGWAVAGLGSNVLVGAPRHDIPATEFADAMPDAGAAYLFNSGSGVLLRTFIDPAPATGNLFGRALAAVGSDVLIGAPFADIGATDAGAAYLFDGASGTLRQTLLSPAAASGDEFGHAVAAVGTGKALVSAHRDNTGGPDAGAAHLFHAASGTFLRSFQKLVPKANDEFGRAVTAVGTRVLVGVPFDDTRGLDAGAAYLFEEATCGNGNVEAGEQCDDSNLVDGDGCDTNCTLTGCGNAIVTAGEQCDDGNTVGGDGCDASCQLEGICGNGVLEVLEQCDDGNLVDGDGCDGNCTVTGCGNAIVTAGEQCDQGSANGDLCCTLTCQRVDDDGDGVCDQEDVCPTIADPLQLNVDWDVFGDACDVCPEDLDNDSDSDGFCTGPAFNPPAIGSDDLCSQLGGAGTWVKPKVIFGNLTVPEKNKMRLKGYFTIGNSVPQLAPDLHGVQIRASDRTGRLVVDEHIPGGTYSKETLRGWKALGGSPATKWKYLDKNKPPVQNGIKQVAVWDRSRKTPGLIRVVVSARTGGTYPLTPAEDPLPLSVGFELNDTAVPPGRDRDQCGEIHFAVPPGAPNCQFVGTNILKCK